jgi:uncharacterized phage protein (TIGR01671 family)
MREITEKYRCWDIMEKKMKPVKGLYFGYCDEEGMHGEEITVLTGKPYVDEEMGKWRNCLTARPDLIDYEMSTASCVLMRFTGLLDKNGKEIYEGDVLWNVDWGFDTRTGNKNVLEVCDGKLGVEFIGNGKLLGGEWGTFIYHPCEVIGNIFENSELISK